MQRALFSCRLSMMRIMRRLFSLPDFLQPMQQATVRLLGRQMLFASAAAVLGAVSIQISHAGYRRMRRRIAKRVFLLGIQNPFLFDKTKRKRGLGTHLLFVLQIVFAAAEKTVRRVRSAGTGETSRPFSFVGAKRKVSWTPKEKALGGAAGGAGKSFRRASFELSSRYAPLPLMRCRRSCFRFTKGACCRSAERDLHKGRAHLGMRQPQSGSFRAILRYQKRESTKDSRFFCLVLRKNLSLCGAKQF